MERHIFEKARRLCLFLPSRDQMGTIVRAIALRQARPARSGRFISQALQSFLPLDLILTERPSISTNGITWEKLNDAQRNACLP